MIRTRRPIVAIIEDHADTRSMLQLLLQDDFTVLVFDTSESALTGLVGKTPDLLVIDIGMPRIDGEQLLLSLRSKLPATQAIAFTGYLYQQNVKCHAEFDAVIYKPEIGLLIEEIYKLTARSQKKAS